MTIFKFFKNLNIYMYMWENIAKLLCNLGQKYMFWHAWNLISAKNGAVKGKPHFWYTSLWLNKELMVSPFNLIILLSPVNLVLLELILSLINNIYYVCRLFCLPYMYSYMKSFLVWNVDDIIPGKVSSELYNSTSGISGCGSFIQHNTKRLLL